jgi:hypothetical protein
LFHTHHHRAISPNPTPHFAQICSATYVRLVLFFVVHTFWMNFYLGVFDTQLGDAHAQVRRAHFHACAWTH